MRYKVYNDHHIFCSMLKGRGGPQSCDSKLILKSWYSIFLKNNETLLFQYWAHFKCVGLIWYTLILSNLSKISDKIFLRKGTPFLKKILYAILLLVSYQHVFKANSPQPQLLSFSTPVTNKLSISYHFMGVNLRFLFIWYKRTRSSRALNMTSLSSTSSEEDSNIEHFHM